MCMGRATNSEPRTLKRTPKLELETLEMLSQFRQRSSRLEHLDIGDYTAEEYEGCMVELRRVNTWLGDTRALRHTLLADIEQAGLKSFSVLDVGAGSGSSFVRPLTGPAAKTSEEGLWVLS